MEPQKGRREQSLRKKVRKRGALWHAQWKREWFCNQIQ